MSCVWIGLIGALNLRITPQQFVHNLQRNNILTTNVWWNGERLSQQTMEENRQNIAGLTQRDITGGYDCSGCDAVLLLVCQLYEVNILHTYNGHKISYIRDYPDRRCSARTINVCADRGHFWKC